ncbi:hypothetical protein OHB26_19685 [Nocardia sp. NBC_01503]|uniref:hypothetical protein n=1 Tax=Nocardia sp. NBC_01503 TaxID=2975997 RepID=UPI002E7BB73E|nr:hypothetical protein [Nocardia sp. NBC_01503]WTL29238.1 hypothetical protein OHB26_19685 [Nocardia sp. NBC_01503]
MGHTEDAAVVLTWHAPITAALSAATYIELDTRGRIIGTCLFAAEIVCLVMELPQLKPKPQ